MDLLRVLVADVLFSAATQTFSGALEPAVSEVVPTFLQVATEEILLLDIFSKNDLVRDPLRHSPTPEQ